MPLTFDLPLDQLKSYTGRNPKPVDFDAFWDAQLAAMRSQAASVELVKADFQAPYADCHDLYFTGVGNARIHAKLLRPRGHTKLQPAVLMFHGYSGDSGDWSDKLGYVAAGYTVAALDCRGQGGKSEDVGGVSGNTLNGHIIRGLDGAPDKMHFVRVFLDTAMLARVVMELPGIDHERVYATGGSQGGALTVACAALEPRIRRAAPVFPFLADYKRVWEMDLAKDAYNELREYFRHFDPTHSREQETFTKLGYVDIQHLASRIKADVLMTTSLMDTICPPSTQFAVYNRIRSHKEMVLYPDFGHEHLPGSSDRIFTFLTA